MTQERRAIVEKSLRARKADQAGAETCKKAVNNTGVLARIGMIRVFARRG